VNTHTVLHHAARSCAADAVECVVLLLAVPSIELMAKDRKGCTVCVYVYVCV